MWIAEATSDISLVGNVEPDSTGTIALASSFSSSGGRFRGYTERSSGGPGDGSGREKKRGAGSVLGVELAGETRRTCRVSILDAGRVGRVERREKVMAIFSSKIDCELIIDSEFAIPQPISGVSARCSCSAQSLPARCEGGCARCFLLSSLSPPCPLCAKNFFCSLRIRENKRKMPTLQRARVSLRVKAQARRSRLPTVRAVQQESISRHGNTLSKLSFLANLPVSDSLAATHELTRRAISASCWSGVTHSPT